MGTFQIGQFTIRREVALLAVLFAIGLGLGLGIARLVIGEPRVSPTEYAILVAQIYERERQPQQAVERLQAAGLPSTPDGLTSLAQSYATQKNAADRDVQSLRNLARDLTGPPTESSTATPAARPIWLLSILVFLFVLGMGSLLAVRILGLPLPQLKLPDLGFGRPPAAPFRRASPTGLNGTGRKPMADGQTTSNRPVPGRQSAPQQPTTAPSDSFLATHPVGLPSSASVGQLPHVATTPMSTGMSTGRLATIAPATIPHATSSYRFRTNYVFGDEPYDEIHPISDRRPLPVSRSDPLGACGMSAARQLDGEGPGRYWGFSAWVQDYVHSDYQHKAVGLVSKWAYLNLSDEIDEWLRSGQIDELKPIEPGATIRLETGNVSATLVVQDFEYGDGLPAETHFSRLAAQFEVDLQLPASDETDDS